ncbi:MAG: DUF2029 domain-containing protein [Chloroflexi bacterium]|nr:DUF2029 domain-containing protein [Chloroflexota bacterium]
MKVKTQEIDSTMSVSQTTKNYQLRYLLDAVIILIMCGLLYYGASWQIFALHTDAAKYQCYATAFWHGVPVLNSFPDPQCAFILHPTITFISNTAIADSLQRHGFPAFLVHFVAAQSPDQSFHALPHEYPLLTILPFSLGLMAPFAWYQVAFAIWMALLASVIYVVLVRFRSRRAAIAYALYLVAGGWATAVGRFDLLPSAMTLFALLCAVRKKWSWAFALLALATMLKFYPVILVLPFLLAQQMASRGKWYAWRRWVPLAMFVAVCAGVMGVSLLLSVEGTLAPLTYFGDRPVQVESFESSLLWLASLVRPQTLHYAFTFGSLNVISSRSTLVSLLGTVLLATGLLYTYWLQWRSKIDLATSSLLTLLIIMLTGKVFSPQYLIWVIPLLAYVGESDLRWLISWVAIGLLTTWIYPYIYLMSPLIRVAYVPLFYPVSTIRNFLLLGFILALLIYCSRRSSTSTPLSKNSMPGVGQVAGPSYTHQRTARAGKTRG